MAVPSGFCVIVFISRSCGVRVASVLQRGRIALPFYSAIPRSSPNSSRKTTLGMGGSEGILGVRNQVSMFSVNRGKCSV